MSEETLWSSMQDAPGSDKKRQEELARLAVRSFKEGGISGEEAERILDVEEPERTWRPPSLTDEASIDPDDLEDRVMNPGEGVGAYGPLLEKQEKPALPPEEAIPDLFEKMKPYRQFLTTILETCREEAATETVDKAVNPHYEYCRCVYTPIALRKMLVTAGALECLEPRSDEAADGAQEGSAAEPDATSAEAPAGGESAVGLRNGEPTDADGRIHGASSTALAAASAIAPEDEDVDEIDDGQLAVEAETEAEDLGPHGSIYDKDGCLVIEDEPEGAWKTTQAGLDYLESIDPEKAFEEALEAHREIDDVFYDVIAYCQETPRNITDIVRHFDDDPRLGPDTYYASFVVDRLEELGALEWKGDWAPTELGDKLLSERPVA